MKKNVDRIIWWNKYIEPSGSNINEIEYVPEKELEEKGLSFDNNIDDRYDFDEDDEIEEVSSQPVVVTTAGIIKLRPYNNISLYFNIWEAQTNFWVTDKILHTLNSTYGVEALQPISPYRFKIAAANVIGFQTTRQNIEKALGVVPKKPNGLV